MYVHRDSIPVLNHPQVQIYCGNNIFWPITRVCGLWQNYYYYYYYTRTTDLLEQEIVSDSGISWAICKSAPCPRYITMPVSHHSVFYRLDALPAAQPTASKH